MRLSFIKIFLILTLFWSQACGDANQETGNGNIISREREVEPYKELVVNGNFELLLKKSSSPGITVTTDENLHEYINIDQEGDMLDITAEKSLISKKSIKLLVRYTTLSAIKASGSAIIRSEDVIQEDYLRIAMPGAGGVNLDVELKFLKVTISGAGMVTLKGVTREQDIELSGAGSLKAYELISQKCKIDISGVGGAAIHVLEQLGASVTGVGGISYKGDPEIVDADISGMGTIRKAEREPEK